MSKDKNIENHLSKNKNYLLNFSNDADSSEDLQDLMNNFLGLVIKSTEEIPDEQNIRIYAVGDIGKIETMKHSIFVIEEFSYNLKEEKFKSVRLGQVPMNVYNVGVYYKNFFDNQVYFSKISSEHQFQNLTESTKPSVSSRKAIYLSKVTQEKNKKEEELLHFHLLRCSTNLSGATSNFRASDQDIVACLNDAVKFDFEHETELNHVLAQIYENKREANGKELKSKIKAHSDKTKDMPNNAVMAFCTFYDLEKFKDLVPSKKDKFDWCYKNTSGLTRLLFKLKPMVNDDGLVKEFSVTLYPNSVFFISLRTNRLYTHEIRPSKLNVERIPTRMGYVVRCSNLEAVYLNGETYIKEDGHLVKLAKMNSESMQDLKDSYYEENKFESIVEYGKVDFSMNLGDYEKPIY